MAKQKPFGFFTLLFFSVWLTAWSAGVAFIQSGVLFPNPTLGDSDGFMWIFVFSHGGSEVLVLWFLTRKLRKKGDQPIYLNAEKSLDSQIVRWQLGLSRPWTASLAALLGCLIYLILFSPIVLSFFQPWINVPIFGTGATQSLSAEQVASALFFSGVWMYTMTWWFKTYRSLITGLTVVVLEASAHSLTVREEQPGPDTAPMVFKTGLVKVELGANKLALTQGELEWSLFKLTKASFE